MSSLEYMDSQPLMNPQLQLLHPYPFAKMATLLQGITPNPDYAPIKLGIGEPQHTPPQFVLDVIKDNLAKIQNYPTTNGLPELRQAIADWVQRRFQVKQLNADTQVLPVMGTREALFSFVQAAFNREDSKRPYVVMPNPFYQIYEGAALLAGAEPVFLNQTEENGFAYDFSRIRARDWADIQLVYVCSPGNPTGKVLSLDTWKKLFELSDHYGFVIAADECYSEIYFDSPPLGALQAAQALGRTDYKNLVCFSSLSKRSNVPGLRSGFVAGDAAVLKSFLLYRTYHGCAMSTMVQAVSAKAWQDELHVAENRRLYREKFTGVMPILAPHLSFTRPDAGFYLWAKTPVVGTDFAKALFESTHVTVLPGRFLAREADGQNPGEDYIRIALVAETAACIEAAERIARFCKANF